MSLAHTGQMPLAEVDHQLNAGVEMLTAFPYQAKPYAARNWGHPLHSLCSYPSKMKPALAHFLVKAFTAPGETVLDPFAGVGTVPFEAAAQGRNAVGTDLSAFAALVTAAKTDPAEPAEVAEAVAQLERDLPDVSSAVDLSTVEPEIRTYFHDDTCREIVASQQMLIEVCASQTRASRTLAAAICHILHGNRPYALSRRSHGIIPIPPKGEFIYKSLLASLRPKLDRLKLAELPQGFRRGRGEQMDAFALAIDDDAIDALITSPPFLGTTEFLRQNRVRLWYCGMSYEEQTSEKGRFVEHQKGLAHYGPLLLEWARVVRDGGHLVMHLGVVKKRDMAEEIRPHVEEAGFKVEKIVYEPAGHLESHGRTDRGSTHTHQFLIARRR